MELVRRYRIRGRVQGVGYRYFTRRIALRLGVRGWVRNVPNGDVEVHAEADSTILARFREELERGPTSSAVDEIIEETTTRTEHYSSFEIRG
ncbi:MAG TPA: acylphosphatase [Terriglobia bacterium]|nr:acylphosphatase [Terriglobia bacterium]